MISELERLVQQDIIAQTWSDGFCTADWCQGERWVVRRADRQQDLWLVAASVDDSAWQIASDIPICPFCGSHLSANIEAVADTRRLAA